MAEIGKPLRVIVVGLGGMGSRWIQVVRAHPASRLVAVVDADKEKAARIAAENGVRAIDDWRDAARHPDTDAILVATPHAFLTEIAAAALAAGKHVFSEKPGGVNAEKIRTGLAIARDRNLRYRVNFHLRLHPAVARAKAELDRGSIGSLLFLRAVYAHGGRPGYENEWWCREELSGGGELIDQGSHLIDLANWFLGPFTSLTAMTDTAFWPIAPLEDNAWLLLRNAAGRVASLHASWTEWKKLFRIELFGELGYLVAEGLGGQYGLERLTQGGRVMGREVPEETVWEFPETAGVPDTALKNSWEEFLTSVRERRDVGPTAEDAVAALAVIDDAYAAARSRSVIKRDNSVSA